MLSFFLLRLVVSLKSLSVPAAVSNEKQNVQTGKLAQLVRYLASAPQKLHSIFRRREMTAVSCPLLATLVYYSIVHAHIHTLKENRMFLIFVVLFLV